MRKTRQIRGLVRFRVPSYLDGVSEIIDVSGQFVREAAGPTIVTKPSRRKTEKALTATNLIVRHRLATDAKKIGTDMARALKAKGGEPAR